MKKTQLPPDLQAAWEKIDGYAKGYGLDYYPIIFEMLDYKTLYEIAAYGGFPIRYPHWRFGMDFEQLAKGYTYGLSVIYEMVINTNPSYAYLLEGNEMVTQKMVMAHVTAHVDFFKHNMWFAPTNRKMLDEMANNASRIQRLIERYGQEQIEDFIDVCLSLDNLIDYHAPYIKRHEAQTLPDLVENEEEAETPDEGLKVERSYMRKYINPPEYLAQQRKKREEELQKTKHFPENPQKDILLFLLNYAPLERWQHTILEIIREEAYYFAPQGMTKIMNEGWACLVAGSFLYTNQGILPIENIVQQKLEVQVNDGQTLRQVYDWVKFTARDTVRIQTRRGFELEGSTTHRVMLPDGQWRPLSEVQSGDSLLLSGGNNLWAQKYVPLSWQPPRRMTLAQVATQANVNVSTVIRYRQGMRGPNSGVLAPLVEAYETDVETMGLTNSLRQSLQIPTLVDEKFGAFLGYLSGDGHISEVKGVIGLTTADEAQADHFVSLVRDLFAGPAYKKWDEGRWRINFYAKDAIAFLQHLGLKTGPAARIKAVPEVILRSPKTVVAAFLRAYYDCDGYAGDSAIILVTASEVLGKTVQLLLLNFGILSTRRRQQDGCWRIHTTGKSAQVFQEQIGFGLLRKQEALAGYFNNRHWFKDEVWEDTIVKVEPSRGPVYDISVAETQRYAAQGFINHNSYWHSRIMTEKAMDDSDVISFAEHHAGVVSTSPGRLNPYKIGLELFRDIEERWNKGKFGKEYDVCDDIQAKRNWDRQLGLGQEKIFEVRQLYNDVTFIDAFLTQDFAVEHKLFSFRHNPHTNFYEIESREFQAVKEKLLFQLTNFGQPFIYVENGNYRNRGELYLRHRYEGVGLKQDYARDTLRNLHKIWTRPVHLETVVDDKKYLLMFDGSGFTEQKV